MLTSEDREWLRSRLHPGDCRQCRLVRALLDATEDES